MVLLEVDGPLLAAAVHNAVHLFNIATGQQVGTFTHSNSAGGNTHNKSKKTKANAESAPEAAAVPTIIRDLAVSAEQGYLATVGDDKAVNIWNIQSGALVLVHKFLTALLKSLKTLKKRLN